jgi:hypothetical protein
MYVLFFSAPGVLAYASIGMPVSFVDFLSVMFIASSRPGTTPAVSRKRSRRGM